MIKSAIGCMQAVLTGVGCAIAFVIIVAAAWIYRGEIGAAYRAFTGEPAEEVFVAGPGSPSPASLRSALDKYERMARGDGPEFIRLSTAEMASLIENGLDPIGQQALDSIEVELREGEFAMSAVLVTAVWGRAELGILGGILRDYEPIYVAGPAWIERPGVLAWEPSEFSVRDIPFPRPTIGPIVRRLTGGRDAYIYIAIPRTVADLEIEPEQVTFFRRTR